jgi:hypothetical protein
MIQQNLKRQSQSGGISPNGLGFGDDRRVIAGNSGQSTVLILVVDSYNGLVLQRRVPIAGHGATPQSSIISIHEVETPFGRMRYCTMCCRPYGKPVRVPAFPAIGA